MTRRGPISDYQEVVMMIMIMIMMYDDDEFAEEGEVDQKGKGQTSDKKKEKH